MEKVMEFEELKRVRTPYEKRARGMSLGEKTLLYFASLRARVRPLPPFVRACVLKIPPFALK